MLVGSARILTYILTYYECASPNNNNNNEDDELQRTSWLSISTALCEIHPCVYLWSMAGMQEEEDEWCCAANHFDYFIDLYIRLVRVKDWLWNLDGKIEETDEPGRQGSPIILSKSAAAVRVGISGVIYEFKKLRSFRFVRPRTFTSLSVYIFG